MVTSLLIDNIINVMLCLKIDIFSYPGTFRLTYVHSNLSLDLNKINHVY